MPSNHLILCHPLLMPSIFPSIGVFSDESALHIRPPKIGNSASSISPSSEYSGLFSFQVDWSDSLQSKELSRVFSGTTFQKDQFIVLSLLYGPALTSIFDYWKNHGFDYMDLCQQSDVSAYECELSLIASAFTGISFLVFFTLYFLLTIS